MATIGGNCPAAVEGGIYGNQSTNQQVLYYLGGALHAVPDPDTLAALGLTFDMVQWISPLCISLMPSGAPFPSVLSGGYGPLAQAIEAFKAGSTAYPPGGSPGGAYPTPTVGSPTVPPTPAPTLGGIGGIISTAESTVKSHEMLILGAGAAYAAWRMGLFRGILGGRR